MCKLKDPKENVSHYNFTQSISQKLCHLSKYFWELQSIVDFINCKYEIHSDFENTNDH